MGQAALQYARRGWPVFPCREREETVMIGGAGGKTRTLKPKQPYGGQGLKDATTDEQRIRAWWKQHPAAMIGVPAGVNGCFVVDFDPRIEEVVDPHTGEVTGSREWTLAELKASLEAQMGVPFPPSLTSRTPSGGVHVWFRQPNDGGVPIRNRGNLPEHVDVRGLGGYVIGAPSLIYDAQGEVSGEYRWYDARGDWRDDEVIADAPAELIAILRAPKARKDAPVAHRSVAPQRGPARIAGDVDDDMRKYAMVAVEGECRAIKEAGSGKRNGQLNASALKVASLVAAGAVDESFARSCVEAAARANPGRDDDAQLLATIASGWTAGLSSPRDLGEIAAASRSRRERRDRSFRPSATPDDAARPAPARRDRDGEIERSFRDGRVEGLQALGEGDRARLRSASAAWFARRIEHLDPTPETVTKLAYSTGRRVAAELLDEAAARKLLRDAIEPVVGVTDDEVDRAFEDGFGRGFDLAPLLLTMKCSGYPMTDFGIAERFRDRYGADYRFTTTQGWLGWDSRRWRVLDQDEKSPPAEVIAAVYETVRAIQSEAQFVEGTGIRWRLRTLTGPRGGEQEELDLEDDSNPHGLDRWMEKGARFVRLCDLLRGWGRQSEVAGKPAAIATLARQWLTAPIGAFDHDPYAVNVRNGTLRFTRETAPDGTRSASLELTPHRREDMLTKLAPVEYDPKAKSPLYDGMFAWAQPDEAMRRYLHQVGGYALTGDAGEQKLWFWYGRGRNGKGVTIESWCYVAGDYSGTIPIGSFLDQGIKKRGDAASPDLAKLVGVRMLRTSEPGRNEKLDSALIKLVTGGEPIPVRNLHRGFFDLNPLFKLIISGNTRFEIPDTDDGIWGRMKLIPWERNILKPEPGVANWPTLDIDLANKIKRQEASGVLNHLVRGLLDYLSNGLAEPKAVTEATAAYRDQSDPLARFLRMCVADESGAKVQSSHLHEVFVAWCKAAGEREWSNKGFSAALAEKGLKKKQSNGIQWLDIRLIKGVSDFVDAQGHVRAVLDADADAGRREDDGLPPDPGFDDMPP